MRPPEHLRADACIKCTVCTAACPVMPIDPAFAGPKLAGPELWRLIDAIERPEEMLQHLEACTNCHLCQTACPHDVPVAHLINWNRERLSAKVSRSWRDRMLSRPDHMAVLLRPARRLLGFISSVPGLWRLGCQLLGLAAQRPAPQVSETPFRTWFARHSPERVLPLRGQRLMIWVDCQSAGFDGEPAKALTVLLERLGYEVVLSPPEASCCGAALISSGRPALALPLARRGLSALRALPEEMPILSLNSTCGPTVGVEWHRLLGLREAAPLASRVQDAMAFLALQVAREDLVACLPPRFGQRLAYHATCRMKEQGLGELVLEVLAATGGQVQLLQAECCGMGGAYGSKQEHYADSLAIASVAAAGLAAYQAAGGQAVCTDSGTCGWQLEHVSGLSAMHPVQALMSPKPWPGGPVAAQVGVVMERPVN